MLLRSLCFRARKTNNASIIANCVTREAKGAWKYLTSLGVANSLRSAHAVMGDFMELVRQIVLAPRARATSRQCTVSRVDPEHEIPNATSPFLSCVAATSCMCESNCVDTGIPMSLNLHDARYAIG